MIKSCRPYFPDSATAEILVELRPLMCPYDVTMSKAMVYLSDFLPVFDTRDRKDTTWGIWDGVQFEK